MTKEIMNINREHRFKAAVKKNCLIKCNRGISLILCILKRDFMYLYNAYFV